MILMHVLGMVWGVFFSLVVRTVQPAKIESMEFEHFAANEWANFGLVCAQFWTMFHLDFGMQIGLLTFIIRSHQEIFFFWHIKAVDLESNFCQFWKWYRPFLLPVLGWFCDWFCDWFFARFWRTSVRANLWHSIGIIPSRND